MKALRRYGHTRRFLPWLVCFGTGIASHLLLDLLPHYAWIVYLPGYEHLPFHWLIREGIVAGIVALPALYFTRRMWPYAIAGMIGGLYPDIEKVAYGDLNLPRAFVAFPWHSTQLSSRDGGFPHGALACAEVLLLLLTLAAVWKLSATQEQQTV